MNNDLKSNVELDELGLQKRRYEIEPSVDSKSGQRIAIGLVLANSFILLKNVLFGGDEAQTAPLPGAVAAGQVQQIQDGVGNAPGQSANGGDNEGEDEAVEKPGSGTSFGLHFEPYSYQPDDGPTLRRPGSGGAVNDNEALYLAKPGRAVGLVSEDYPSVGASGPDDGATPDGDADAGGDDDDKGDPGSGDGDEQEIEDDGEPGGPIDTRPNRLPSVPGAVVLAAILANEVATVAEASLLHGATDADGDGLSVTNLTASSGSILKRSDGIWVFTPDKDDTSDVVFTYTISDGEGSITQTAFMDILPRDGDPEGSRIIGTSGTDLLIGTERDDWIDALEGDDDILAREGDDTILGGPGNDRIVAGDGNDLVFAGDGDDVVFAGAGDDVVFAGLGNDIVYGEDGNDTLMAEDGNDVAIGGAGDDLIDGGKGNDRIQGDDGNDTLIGGLGDDIVDGGVGNDVVTAGGGDDVVDAGMGNDRVYLENGDDIAIAGAGDDFIDGGEGNDRIQGNDGDDTLIGGPGDDEICGGAGNDTIAAGDGADVVYGGAGDDLLIASQGDDVYDGGDGVDTFSLAETNADAVIDLSEGTASSAEIGSDTLASVEVVIGGNGNDVIIASKAVETFMGGDGNDIFVFSSSASAGRGSGGRDRIIDFEVGDRIDIDDISEEFEDAFDATFVDHGIRKFVIIDQHISFSKPGQMKVKYEEAEDRTVLEGNIDTTTDSEFEIELAGYYKLADSDFHWRG